MYLRQNQERHKASSYREGSVEVRLINRRRLKALFEPKTNQQFTKGQQVSLHDGLTTILGTVSDVSHPHFVTVEDCQGFFHLAEACDMEGAVLKTLCLPMTKFSQGYDQRKSGAKALVKPMKKY